MARDLVSLLQDRKKAIAALETVDASADGGQVKFDAAVADVDALDQQIENAKKLQDMRGRSAIESPESGLPNPAPTAVREMGFMAQYRNLPAADHIVRPGAMLSNAQSFAFRDLLTSVRRAATGRGMDSRLVEVEASTGGGEQTLSDGGFLVEKDVADALIQRMFANARISSRARRIPISAKSNGLRINALKDNSRATGSRWGGVQGYRIGEGDTLTPSRPKFRQMTLQLKKYAALVYGTDELLADAAALAGVINEAVPAELAFMVDDDMFEGAGTAGMLGFMNAGCKVSVSKETGQAAATIVKENIDKMWARLQPGSMPRAEWWINQNCFPQLNSLSQVVGTGGIPVYLPPGGLSQSPNGTLMGRPVIPVEFCSSVGTAGDIALVDPGEYLMIDKGDVQYATSIHVAFLTSEQAFRFIYRVDGQPVADAPITPFKGTDTLSSFVVLATRA